MQNTNNPGKVPEPVGSVAGYFIVILGITNILCVINTKL